MFSSYILITIRKLKENYLIEIISFITAVNIKLWTLLLLVANVTLRGYGIERKGDEFRRTGARVWERNRERERE